MALLPTLLCLLVAQFQCTQAQNQKPRFVNTTEITAGRSIKEDTPTGTVIATVSAIDPEGGPVTYSLDGSAAQKLEIDSITGQIKIKSPLDFDGNSDPTLQIIVIAADNTGAKTAFLSSLQIEDANDLEPYFTETYYNFERSENTPVGNTITALHVKDRDTSNSLISVTCDTATTALARACEVFELKTHNISNQYWNGFLVLRLPLDYENEKSYSVRLIAKDGKENHTILQEVQIGVLDVNDSPPSFVRAQGIVIPEGKPAGSYLDYVSAVDTDEVDSRPVRYELVGNAEAKRYFRINPMNGSITTLKALDYEDPDRTLRGEFTLIIRARELLNNVSGALGNDNLTTAITNITVRLTDINDNCPQFDREEYFVNIPEDISQGSNIPLQMTVTDADSDLHSNFNLQLIDPSATFAVSPTSGRSPTGVTVTVVSSANIDYERPPRTYTLTVRATGNESQSCSGSTVVRITVQDVNDELPQFPQGSYSAQVKENAGEGTIITTVTATDLDSGRFGTAGLRYSLSGNGQELFKMDPVSGIVTVARCAGTPGVKPCIDYEERTRYDLAVEARDNEGGTGSLVSIVRLGINVIDFNDNSPRFNTEYVRSIREGQTVTTDPLFIKAVDTDGRPITYTIPRLQNEAQFWTIDAITGNITAIRPIQYSDLVNTTRGSFIFKAMAFDGDYSDLVDITIYVIDENNHSPEFFPHGNFTFSVAENAPYNTYIATIACSDGDAPTTGNGQVDVSIEEGGFNKFTVRPNGTTNNYFLTQLFTSSDAQFDYDTQSRYTLKVVARDRGSPSRTGTTYVFINILDINNKNPYFDPPTTSVAVRENQPVGYLVTTVTAKDNDLSKQLEIRFSGLPQAFNPSGVEVTDATLFQDLFSIDKQGNVRVNRRLDRDVVSFMSFNLFVEDINSDHLQNGSGVLFIRILEYNDQAPYFELPFYNLSVLEERPLSTFVGSILARDEDDQIRAYQLRENPGDLFTISVTSGVLQVNGRLDYERQHNVTLVAVAFDNGSPSLSNSTTIFINIVNINDNTPVFSQNVYQMTLIENTTRTDSLMTVSATDKDEGDYGEVRYAADDPYLRVDPITGEIFMKPGAVLDREKESTHSFLVTAYDSPNNATNRLNTTVSVYIALEDKNDNCPIFDPPARYSGVVIETADIGDQVLEMYATDADSGINGRIKFTIDRDTARPSNAYELFSIQSIQSDFADKESGRIEVRTSLRDNFGVYNFTVIASDMNGENSTGDMCSTRVPVTVRVQEAINDSPTWRLPPSNNFSIEVLESQYRGMLVYDCLAVDENTGQAGIVDYYFNVQRNLTNATPEFRINRVTGVITAAVVFDREEVYSYVLTVVAKDRGDPPASSVTLLIVNVLDVNDNDPEFPMRNGETIPYNFKVPEGASAGIIGVVSATDRDSENKNNKVYYRIAAGNNDGFFALDQETGELSTARSLDREERAEYTMDILAYNEVHDDTIIRQRRKRSIDPSVVTVTVTVEDVNDTPPSFTDTDYHGCVARDARFGQSITRVEAVDEDLNGGSAVQYVKVIESTGDYFSVTSLGVIRNVKLLYDISSRQPVLGVQANDSLLTAETSVKIFVTDESNEVVLKVSQPLADVRAYKDQLIRVVKTDTTSSPNSIKYVCILEMRDGVGSDGAYSFTTSEVVMAAVRENGDGTHYIYPAGELRGVLLAQFEDEEKSFYYRTLHVDDVVTATEGDAGEKIDDSVLAIFIIAILLVFLAILLFLLACCLIRNSKKKKIEKLKSGQIVEVESIELEPTEPIEVETSYNPTYDNQGYTGDDVYAVVQKPGKKPEQTSVSPAIVPVIIPTVASENPDDVYIVEPVPSEPGDYEEPYTIITEPIMDEEAPQQMAPPPDDFFEDEPVIETHMNPYDEIPEEDEIDTEIRDSSSEGSAYIFPPDPRARRLSPTPPSSRTPSPPPFPEPEEYPMEDNIVNV